MKKGFNEAQQLEIEKSAIINQYTYLDSYKDFDGKQNWWQGRSLTDIANDSQMYNVNYGDKTNVLRDAIQADVIKSTETHRGHNAGDMTLISHSALDAGIDENHLVACAYQDTNGDIYVSYRGTGDGKWIDNGEGLTKEQTLMQQKALEYFDYVAENYPTDGKIIVTGHSKGGDMAQFVTMKSEHGDMIDACYSMNGQGFSKKAVQSFKDTLGETGYNSRLDKMYYICGDNDYVHTQGLTIIRPENTYYIPTTTGIGPSPWHQLEGFFDENGNFAWPRKDDNSINWNHKQGLVGQYAKALSERVMQMDDEYINDAAITVMTAAEILIGDDAFKENLWVGTGERQFATSEEIKSTMAVIGPLLTLAAADVMEDTAENLINNYKKEVNKFLNTEQKPIDCLLNTIALAYITPSILANTALLYAGSQTIKLQAKINLLVGVVIETLVDILAAVSDGIGQIRLWIADIVEIAVAKLRDVADHIVTSVCNFVSDTVQFIKDGIDNIIDKFRYASLIQITPENISSQANTVRQYKADHVECINALRRLVYTLNESWQGEAQTAFVQKFQSMEAVYSGFATVLDKYADLMDKAGADMHAADVNLTSMIQSI